MIERVVGIPWKEGGHTHDGCDCYGLVRLWYRTILGVHLPPHDPQDTLLARSRRFWKKVDEPEEHDIVLVEERDGSLHVGIVVGNGLVLHADKKIGSIVSRIPESSVLGYYRLEARA